jgi:hypothetical protein
MHELDAVARAQPRAEVARVGRPRGPGLDPQAGDLQAVLVVVQARDAGRHRRLEHPLRADDVRLEDHVERRVDGVGGEVHDRVHPRGGGAHRIRVRDAGGHDLLPVARRLLLGDVEQPQQLVAAAQPRAQVAADRAGGAGDQDAHHPPAAYSISDSSTSHSTGAWSSV